eukprot:jgi/Astpho2/2433/Aster-05684
MGVADGLQSGITADTIAAALASGEDDAWVMAQEGTWFPNRGMQMVLRFAQEQTGLPWWETIACCTLLFRACTLPANIMSIKNTYKMSAARPEIEKLANWHKAEALKGNSSALPQYQAALAAVWEKHGCHPLKSVAPMLVQAPIFIGFFSSLTSLAQAKIPSMTHGGLFWFTDLTAADPSYALPIITFSMFLLAIELGSADGMQGQSPKAIKTFKNVMRGVVLIAIPFSTHLSAGVFTYMFFSNVWTLMQGQGEVL